MLFLRGMNSFTQDLHAAFYAAVNPVNAAPTAAYMQDIAPFFCIKAQRERRWCTPFLGLQSVGLLMKARTMLGTTQQLLRGVHALIAHSNLHKAYSRGQSGKTCLRSPVPQPQGSR